jgi:hypothetical protein
VFYGSNPHRKDNPRWGISNATETPAVPDAAIRLLLMPDCLWDHPVSGASGSRVEDITGRVRGGCGICVAWLAGLPRRAGAVLHALSDTEARWWHWNVTERCGGLVHQYRDARFEALPYDPSLRSDDLEL